MSEWRAVPPNFPEIDQHVLWLYPDGAMAVWEMDKDMDWDWVKQGGPNRTPTHWMPLPEPPTQPMMTMTDTKGSALTSVADPCGKRQRGAEHEGRCTKPQGHAGICHFRERA